MRREDLQPSRAGLGDQNEASLHSYCGLLVSLGLGRGKEGTENRNGCLKEQQDDGKN